MGVRGVPVLSPRLGFLVVGETAAELAVDLAAAEVSGDDTVRHAVYTIAEGSCHRFLSSARDTHCAAEVLWSLGVLTPYPHPPVLDAFRTAGEVAAGAGASGAALAVWAAVRLGIRE
eukprot:Hpha_TRINITY_DN6663_c0_g1::TRINITY_DN6663_c0_g1_i2::g.26417::m.26417